MDEEQKRAFDAIMAEIEADHRMDNHAVVAGDADDGPHAPPDGTDAPPAAGAAAADGEAGEPSSEDGLDDEQQQAFEAIMAEIEAGGNTDDHEAATAGQPPNAKTDSPTRSTGASSAAVDHSATTDASSEELDEDQQRAFANIMAQIQGQEGDPAASSAEPSDGPPPPDSPVETGTTASEEHTEDNAGGASSGDGADEIEKILADIAADQAAPDSAPTATGMPVINADGHAEKDPTDGADTGAYAGTADEPEQEKPRPSGDGSGLPATGDPERPDSASTAASGHRHPSATPVDNPPTPPSPARKRLRALIVATAVVAMVVGTGYLYLPRRTIDSPTSTAVPEDAPAAETIAAATVPPGTPHDTAPPSPDRTSDQERLKTVIDALNALRDQLIDKQSDVDALRTYYQAGIDAEMQTIAITLANAGTPLPSMDQALADPRIELGLAAIQRRDTTLRKLVGPLTVLHHAGEEVLFWSRKAEFLLLMAAKTSDIDINGYVSQVNRVMDRHQRVLGELNIDSIQESPLGMEVFWRRIIARLPKQAEAERSDSPVGDDAAIARRICSGDFTDKHRLTTLSPEVARCLAQWEGKDLFLNGLTELTPEAARHLAQWNGDWLGLNGLTTLSPEAAAHLARWTGRGLSLNGLARLSPRIVAILSEWQGEQIELINVQHMAHWENPNVRLFLSENLNRQRPIARN